MGKQDSSDSSSIKVHPTDANGSKLTSGPTDTHRTRRVVGLQVDQPKFGRVWYVTIKTLDSTSDTIEPYYFHNLDLGTQTWMCTSNMETRVLCMFLGIR